MVTTIYLQSKVNENQTCSTKQVTYLRFLTRQQGLEFPFSSLKNTKKHLSIREAGRAISSLLEGNTVIFVNLFPKKQYLLINGSSSDFESQ